MAKSCDALRSFPAALEETLSGWARGRADPGAEGFLRPVAALRDRVPAAAGGGAAARPAGLPVCRFWEEALNRAAPGGAAVLADALRGLGPALRWTQNPNYRRRPPDPAFLANYGYAVIAGPAEARPLLDGGSLAVGVLLMGPATHYPAHRHPAAELYHVVAGDAEWRRAGEAWRREPAGAVVRHPPNLPHAMRTGRAPLLAVYLWQGDLATHARLLPADAPRAVLAPS